jgi:hypothetical protein
LIIFSESLEKKLLGDKMLKFFDVDADLGSRNLFEPGVGIRDGKNSDPGCLSQIRNTDRKDYVINS